MRARESAIACLSLPDIRSSAVIFDFEQVLVGCSSALCQYYCLDSFCSGCPYFVRDLLKVDLKHLVVFDSTDLMPTLNNSPIIVLFR